MADFCARFEAPAAGLLALALFALLHAAAPAVYDALLGLAGIPLEPAPFSDLAAILRAVHCAATGVNVQVNNACMGGGIYNYSPLLLRLHVIGALPRMGTGLVLDIAFILSLAALPPPHVPGERLARLLAVLSGAVIFALERVNLDAVIFLITMLGCVLCLGGTGARLLGLALFTPLAAIKYYPAALLVLLAREGAKLRLAVAAVLAVFAGAYFFHYGTGVLASLLVLPRGGPLGNCFGGIDVPLAVSLFFAAMHGGSTAVFHLPPAGFAAYAALLLAALWRASRRVPAYRPSLARLAPARLVFLIAGAALICFCFIIAQNIMYRAIFLILTLPGLAALRADAAALPRGQAYGLIPAVLALLWEEPLRQSVLHGAALLPGSSQYILDILFWAGREALWWWVVTQFLAILLAFLQRELLLHPRTS